MQPAQGGQPTCGKSLGVKWAVPKASADSSTAAGTGIHLVSVVSRKPRNTVSSSTGARMAVRGQRGILGQSVHGQTGSNQAFMVGLAGNRKVGVHGRPSSMAVPSAGQNAGHAAAVMHGTELWGLHGCPSHGASPLRGDRGTLLHSWGGLRTSGGKSQRGHGGEHLPVVVRREK
jgi:hypothetical protein